MSTTRAEFVRGIAQLLFYQTKNGNMEIPPEYVTGDHFPLGEFVVKIRELHHEGMLTREQVDRLQNIGFAMDADNQTWETMFSIVKRYIEEHQGHIPKVTERSKDCVLVGAWVREQRLLYKRLEKEKQERLQAIGIIPGGQ